MIINRDNYETLFLLYVDNELSESERVVVEQFLQQNPDLAEEMEMLQQTVLPMETLEFDQKEFLFNKTEGITINNYEEYFVLSIDNELTAPEEEAVEKFVLQHPALQNEFEVLKKTRLEPETVVFEGKDELYRKARKETPVIFLSWMKVSVAAAIIGLAVMTWFFYDGNGGRQINTSVAASDKPKGSRAEVKQPVLPIEKPAINAPIIKEGQVAASEVKKAKRSAGFAKAGETTTRRDEIAVNTAKRKQDIQATPAIKVDKVLETPVQDKKAFEEAIASAKIANNNSTVAREKPNDVKLTNKTNAEQSAFVAKQVVYKELDTRENEEENTFYIGSAEINKNKLKGLFRKAATLFDKKSDNNDEEKTLRIAGFEIKSK